MFHVRTFLLGLLCGIFLLAALPPVFPGFSWPPFLLPPSSVCPSSAAPDCPSVQPLFSPGSGDALRSLIRSAKNSLDIEMYVFTDRTLASELSSAAARGVRVRLILESRTDARDLDALVRSLREGGVEVRWASLQFQLTHSKLMVVDGRRVLVGSINFSHAAQNKNREAAAVIGGPRVADYLSVFEQDWAAGVALRPPANSSN